MPIYNSVLHKGISPVHMYISDSLPVHMLNSTFNLPVVGILYSVAHDCMCNSADTKVLFLCLCTTLPYREVGTLWHMETSPSDMVIFQNK